jgi:hypothetical protein
MRVVINKDGSQDPTRGTGPEKETVTAGPEAESTGRASGDQAGASGEDPSRGGCLRLGWGCLPVSMGLAMLPLGHFFF